MKTYLQFLNEDITDGFYSYRNLTPASAEFLYTWMQEEGVPNPIPIKNLHVTVVCSENGVPGYAPDPALVMVSPATFKIEMMQEALVIKFKSDALDEQFTRAMNMGAKSRYPKFVPHISLSYNVPESYDVHDLKPPLSHLVLDAEQQRPLIDGWAKLNGLREYTGDIISDNPGIYVPQNNLNVPREAMPQIADAHKFGFIDWLEEQGILVQYLDIPVSILRPVQKDIDLKKIEQLLSTMSDEAMRKPVIVSKDSFILDGHHRWLALLNRDPHQMVRAYRVNLPIQELLDVSRKYTNVYYKPTYR